MKIRLLFALLVFACFAFGQTVQNINFTDYTKEVTIEQDSLGNDVRVVRYTSRDTSVVGNKTTIEITEFDSVSFVNVYRNRIVQLLNASSKSKLGVYIGEFEAQKRQEIVEDGTILPPGVVQGYIDTLVATVVPGTWEYFEGTDPNSIESTYVLWGQANGNIRLNDAEGVIVFTYSGVSEFEIALSGQVQAAPDVNLIRTQTNPLTLEGRAADGKYVRIVKQ